MTRLMTCFFLPRVAMYDNQTHSGKEHPRLLPTDQFVGNGHQTQPVRCNRLGFARPLLLVGIGHKTNRSGFNNKL